MGTDDNGYELAVSSQRSLTESPGPTGALSISPVFSGVLRFLIVVPIASTYIGSYNDLAVKGSLHV
jgi:hypothetical protein